MSGLSRSRTEMKTMPWSGNWLPAPSWDLAKAAPKSRSRPITSPVDFISGPSSESTFGKAREREHRLLDRDVSRRALGQIEAGERLAGHHPGRDLGDRPADRLGDEGHRARGARVDLEDEDLAVLDRHLDVHQAAHLERPRQDVGLTPDLGQKPRLERMRRQRAGAVAGMDAGLLDVLHDAGDEHIVRRRPGRRRRPRSRPAGSGRSGSARARGACPPRP